MVAGWGTGAWGTSYYGFGYPSALYIAGAYPSSERTCVVTTSIAPAQVSPINPGDALNPRTWSLVRDDTGKSMLVMAVRVINTTTFELYSLDLFPGYGTTCRVSAPQLVQPTGVAIAVPDFADFEGCKAYVVTQSQTSLVDLKNAPASTNETSGTLQVGTNGDYALEGGVPFLKKLIYRRLVTAPGEFFYLPNTYGVGVAVKSQVLPSDLVMLQGVVQRQISQEPAFSAVQVQLRIDATQTLYITVNAVLAKTNQTVVIPIAVPTVTV